MTTADSHIGSNRQHRLSDQVPANTAEPSGRIVSDPRRYPRNARNAAEIHGFSAAVPEVRIHLPPAESQQAFGFLSIPPAGDRGGLALPLPHERRGFGSAIRLHRRRWLIRVEWRRLGPSRDNSIVCRGRTRGSTATATTPAQLATTSDHVSEQIYRPLTRSRSAWR